MDKLIWYDNDGRINCRRGYEVALARLASYEATGMMPDEIIKMGMAYEDSKRYSGRLELKLNAAAKRMPKWVSVTEQLPESNHKNDHVGDVLCYVPPRDGCRQSGLYLGKIRHVKADDGSGNFWGRPTPESDWTLWGWSYFEKPVVTHWMPLPEPPKEDSRND